MTITISPLYPVTGEEVAITATNPSVGGSARVVLTSAPSRSALTELDSTDGGITSTFTPDVQGAYVLTAYYYRRAYGIGGSGAGTDPGGESIDELTGAESTTVYVGAYADLEVRTAEGHGATLRLTVANATVRAAEWVDFTSERARMASLQAGVVAALAALVDVTVANLDDALVADVAALMSAYSAHRILTAGPVHRSSGDTTNTLSKSTPYAVASAIDALNDLHDKLVAHMTTGGAWHQADDTKNVPVARKASDLASATVLRADLRERVYERHRVQTSAPAAHDNADNTNTMGAPKPLTSCIVAFLDALVTETPTAGTGEQEGAGDLANAFGFTIRDSED